MDFLRTQPEVRGGDGDGGMYEQLKALDPDSSEQEKIRLTDDNHFKQSSQKIEEEKRAERRATHEGLTNQNFASTDAGGSEDESGADVEWRQRRTLKEPARDASSLAVGATEAEEKKQTSRETRRKRRRYKTDGVFRRTFNWLNGNRTEHSHLKEEVPEDLFQGADGRR
ncbi:unnamed protein product [Gadus morhua 'NCC']